MRNPLLLSGLLALAGVFSCFAEPAAPSAAASASEGASEAEPKIDGIALARAKGGYIGVTIDGIRMKVSFYDEKKKPVAPDVVRITARWNPPRVAGGMKHSVLLPEGENSLMSPSEFRPPHTYLVFLVLIGPDDSVVEQFTVYLNQLGGSSEAAGAAEGAGS